MPEPVNASEIRPASDNACESVGALPKKSEEAE